MSVDRGYFPRGTSALRLVHEQRAVGLLYGQRALAIGAIAPLNFIGTRLHTRAPDRPFERLARTGKIFETIFFGTRAEADAALERVANLHSRVNGEIPEAAGPFAAGTPYSALDPELMLWTIAVIADSAKVFHELFVGPLDASARDALWADYVRFGALFGMPPDAAPGSWREFDEWYRGRLDGAAAHLTPEARYQGSSILFHIPVPARDFAAMRIHNLLMLGALPPRVRELYGLRWTPVHSAAFAAAVVALRAARPVTPRVVRSGDNTFFFDRVAETERTRAERGVRIRGALA